MRSRVVAVTGSASGMGRATAELLRARGDRVIGVDLHDADVRADLSSPSERDLAVASIAELSGGVLHGAAAFAGVSGFGGRPGGVVVGVNHFGAVGFLRGIQPLLARSGGASAIAVSSNAATTAPGIDEVLVQACLLDDEARALARADEIGGPAAYAASKLALARWVRRASTTTDWIGSGISLNAIAPGKVDTPLVTEMANDPVGRAVLDRLPLPAGRGARPEEIAALAAFLLSEDARFLVGSIVLIDGGTEAHVRPDDWPAARSSERELGAPRSFPRPVRQHPHASETPYRTWQK